MENKLYLAHMMNSFNSTRYSRVILGVDPGTNILGFALIGIIDRDFELIDMGVFNMQKQENHLEKLKMIAEELSILMDKFKPDELAIEAPFFGKNVQSMLKLGRAQGVAMTVAITKGIHITEYSPKKIKQSITGNGNASKEQVSGILGHLCNRSLDTEKLDATDALATAICHHYQRITPNKSSKSGGWSAFLKSNPDRVNT